MSSKHPYNGDERLSPLPKRPRLDYSEKEDQQTRTPHLRDKVRQLIEEYGHQAQTAQPLDTRTESERLIDIFIGSVWPTLRSDYDQMMQNLQRLLETTLKKDKINSDVTARIKEVVSAEKTLKRREAHLRKQLQTKAGFKDLDHIFQEMHDLCGLRIILWSADDLDKARKLINKSFIKMKEPANFSPDRKVGKSWETWFGAYETQNHRLVLAAENEGGLAHYSGVMFEIQLTTLSNYLYNKLAHDLLYKGSLDLLTPQDEMVIDLSHGVARCFELCVRILKHKLDGNTAQGNVAMEEDTGRLMETLDSRQVKEAQSAVEEFEEDLPENMKASVVKKLSQLITQQLGYIFPIPRVQSCVLIRH